MSTDTDNGEVTLKPAQGAEFGGSSLPGGWTGAPWSAGGSATVAGGRLHVDGASAGPSATYGSGRSLEFDATFTSAPFQTLGFATDLNAPPWATFSTKSDGAFYARTSNGSVSTETPLSSSLLGSSHRYRIEWAANEVRFFVDGAPVATHSVSFADNMRPLSSDFNPGGTELAVDWLRMSPYPASGSFESRILDAGENADWGALAWDSDAPAGTGVELSVRTGNTATPDGSWSSFSPIANSGDDIPGNSRYVQYRARLTTGDAGQTPALGEVSVGYAPVTDQVPPTISQRTPAPDAIGVPRDQNVSVQFSEAMDPTTVDGSSLRLRKQGAGADVPASVSYSGNTATLNPTSDLDQFSVYEVTVAGSVKDANGNSLGAADSWIFTAGGPAASLTDTTVSDFGAGSTGADTSVTETDNGEITLKPAVGAEFSGSGLPAGFSSQTWESQGGGTGGNATVSGGALHVNGAYAGTDATFSSGRSLEFNATFGASNFQHAGFSDNFNSVWAMFSTANGSNQLFARVNNGSSQADVPIPGSGSLIGSEHRYRIEWAASEVRFYVDGSLVSTQAASFGTAMNAVASDFNVGGPGIDVDWMRMSPYPASGSFDSRVLDAGGQVNWQALSWSADTPAGTGVALSARTGNTATPDGSWSSFSPVGASGNPIGGSSRYIQYRAALSTTDSGVTPVLHDVTVSGTEAYDNPSAVDDEKTVAEDSGASPIDVLANDLNGDGGPLQINAASEPDHGTVEVNGAGTELSYSPDADYCNTGEATDDFTYTLNGGSEAQVKVRVDCVDDNPSAVDDRKDGRRGLRGKPDRRSRQRPERRRRAAADHRRLRARPRHGRSQRRRHRAQLRPDADYCNTGEATDDFTYTLNGGCEAQVKVRVDCVDDNPSAVDDQKTVAEDSGASPIDVLANDLNGDGGPLQINAASEPDHGTVEVNGAGTELSYSPDADYCNTGEATDDFTYTLNGGSEAQVKVRVDCVDDNPSAVDDQKTVAEDSGASPIDVLANDLNGDGGPLQITAASEPDHGTVEVNGAGTELSYSPDADYCNTGEPTDDFTYTLNGGSEAQVKVQSTASMTTRAPSTTKRRSPRTPGQARSTFSPTT